MPLKIIGYHSSGVPQRRWEPYLMPRWPDEMLESSFFIFASQRDAETGRPTGGSGFFVGVPWEGKEPLEHVYAVTCAHVISSNRPHVLRAERLYGDDPTFIDARTENWFIAEHDDLAVMRIEHGHMFSHESFPKLNLTREMIDDYSVGIGDEVVSVGRFLDLRGNRANRPLVRSGTIAAMPELPISCRNRPLQDSYIAEMKSRSGFSGSPVFVYLPPPQIRFVHSQRQIYSEPHKPFIKMFEFYGPWLLGVHWGEINVEGPDAPWLHASLDNDRRGMELGSGMIGIVPCSRLETLLMKDKRVLTERKTVEKEFRPQASAQAAVRETKKRGAEPEHNPSHKEDFRRLLGVAARKHEQED